MNIYTVKALGTHGGGMAVVAARNEDEAIKYASVISSHWNVRYGSKKDSIVTEICRAPKGVLWGVLDHYETGE